MPGFSDQEWKDIMEYINKGTDKEKVPQPELSDKERIAQLEKQVQDMQKQLVEYKEKINNICYVLKANDSYSKYNGAGINFHCYDLRPLQ